jgi:RHS repeat-associated protein
MRSEKPFTFDAVAKAPSDNADKKLAPPAISLPKGGGAIRGIGEKFAANPVAGTGSLSVPIPTSPGRSGFGPQLSLAYDSGAGNGPFGFGWSLALPAITRKTDKGLPQYRDAEESDVFLLSGTEDLVPSQPPKTRVVEGIEYQIQSYRPRIEGLFARIERWTHRQSGAIHWRSITRDNVVTLYGKDNDSRIFDPSDPDPENPTRIFTWLISESYDDKGNAVLYEYKAENQENVDLSQAHERNRTPASRAAQRYPKRIHYGNRVSRLVQPDLSPDDDWMFEVVFDYGEHDAEAPMPEDAGAWLCRSDPFSSYRAGFETRTYRLCRRILMFHHFPGEDGVGQDCLVRSTDLHFADPGDPIASFVAAVTQSSYKRNAGGYLKKSMPAVEFEYSRAVLQDEIRELDAASLENLPDGLDGTRYQWVDLDGEGIPGILTEQADGWFYKRNISPIHSTRDGEGREIPVARFAPVELVAHKPSPAELNIGWQQGRQQLLDLAGDGQIDLVQFQRPLSGFYERTEDGSWSQFTPFAAAPTLAWNDPNLKFIDLTGDGHADVLISEDRVFTWYPSLGEDGFGAAERVAQALDEEKGPRLLFADGTQSIYLADMSGDGLIDLVRIRNGEVCYWPNLGYGRFGAMVTMDNAPWLDRPELFDQRLIRLADIDGSGVTDILYLGRDGVRIFFNQSGNRWSEMRTLPQFPPTDNLSAVTVVDLFGNGTACLVWSSPLPGAARRTLRYIDLMGGEKPHLLIGMKNNLGAETRVRYAPSTKQYLADKLNGKPWVTRLSFPVHVVERIETFDRISRNRFVTRYAYHHGYFDGVEREFRGFGMVEQWDTEEIGSVPGDETSSMATNLDAASFVPPIYTRTWFHTGIYLGRERVASCFAQEYYHEPGLLEDTVLPPGLTVDEEREACRALRGSMLRQEVYGLDGTDKAQHPYTVTEQSFTIECLQPQGANRHAVFFTHPREALSVHTERNPHDPRIGHAMTLEVDPYGNVLKSVTINYGRKQSPLAEPADQDRQTRTLITYTENRTTTAVDDADHPDDYRTPLPREMSTFELTGYTPASAGSRFQISDFVTPDPSDPGGRRQISLFDSEIEYEAPATTGRQRRLIERTRTLYRKNDLSGFLTPGDLESLALPGQSYQLAFTPGLLAEVYENRLPDPAQVLGGKGSDQGGYVDLDGDGRWWIPSGQIFYSLAASAATELAEAQQHFFLPKKFTDPFDFSTTVEYDAHDLLVIETTDAAQNTVTALHDYRVLQPRETTDPNGNRSAAAFDVLGMVVGTAIMGKATGSAEGDSLAAFTADLTTQQIKDYFDAPDPRALAVAYLGTATTRILYDLDRIPACAATIARETHVSDLAPGEATRAQLSFIYSDGFGREVQTKAQAEPGPLDPNDPASPMLNPRWAGTGTKIYNNKGKPVRQYEPFFSSSHHLGIEQHGVSSTLFYDPAERVVATLHPNHTWEKVVFDPWQQSTYDVNDTVQNTDGSTDPKADADVKGFFSRLPDADYLPTWYEQRIALAANDPERIAAKKAAVHRQTPTVAHLDTLGRAFLTIAHNRFERDNLIIEEKYPLRVTLDIEGNQREVRDAVVQDNDSLGRVVMRYGYDMLGHRVYQAGMEAGERWTLTDIAEKPIRAWDSRGFTRRSTYDGLRRSTGLFVTEAGVERLAERTLYGESQGMGNNHRARVFQLFDSAGVVTNEAYDFKGNLLHSKRELLPGYKGQVDWQQNPTPSDGTFTSSTTFDALNRPMVTTAPDNSIYRPTYNEANLLNQVEVNLRGAATATPFVTNIDYDAKGQRTLIQYANGVTTTYEYDDQTFRLVRLKTTRQPGQNGLAAQIFASTATVQDLRYTYDPVGNITRIEDAALLTIFHSGQQVEPVSQYIYDAVYRLIEAQGREHIGQSALNFDPPGGGSFRDHPFTGLSANPNDLQALRNYTEQYRYDAVGNFEMLDHQAGPGGSWTRVYAYDEPSLVEATQQSNRLSGTAVGQTTEIYTYDAHGNMTAMPHLALMQWDFKDQLVATSRQATNNGTPETTFYVYDAAGQRMRKVTERPNGTRKNERIYLGGFEIYREHNGNGTTVTLERETLHVMDDKRRIALIETKTVENGNAVSAAIPEQRYELGNHLGSASLELDADGSLISYEEYHPYGTTAYQAMSAAEVSLKRYRYTGKERDEETGLTYHGARYCAPWLARWISPDPAGLADGANVYAYVSGNPIRMTDPTGRSGLTMKVGESTGSTPDDARLMEAGYATVVRIQTELRDYFGIETTLNYETKRYSTNTGCSSYLPGASSDDEVRYTKITLDISTDEQAQKDAMAKLRTKLTTFETAKGGSAAEIQKRVDERIASLEKARTFLKESFKEGFTLEAQLKGDKGSTLLGMWTKSSVIGNSMYVNPYTFFREDKGKWVEGIEASSSRARAAVGPGLQLLHELVHYREKLIAGGKTAGAADVRKSNEIEAINDVDKAVKTISELVAQREWYGATEEAIDSQGRQHKVNQGLPGKTYVLGTGSDKPGTAGALYEIDYTDLTGKEWIKWPTTTQLTTGRK